MDGNARPVSAALAVAAAVLAVGAPLPYVPRVAVAGILGLAGLIVGLSIGSDGLVLGGGAGLFGEVVLAGIEGITAGVLLATTALAIVAVDLGRQAISMHAEMGAEARTAPVELRHGGASLAVAGGAALFGYVVVARLDGDIPEAGLALLVVAAIGLVVALR